LSPRHNILITGGGGMLAGAFGSICGARGFDSTHLPRAQLDITDPLSVIRALDDHKPSIVLNCAAYTKVDRADTDFAVAENINGKAVGVLAEACKRRDVLLVHFSTDYVFDGTLRRPLLPDDPVGPQSGYGVSKLLGERLLKDIGPRHLLIRTAWLYGPGGPNFVQTMLGAARAGKPLRVINDQHGSPTFTHDLAAATLALIGVGATGTFHVTNGNHTTWFEFAHAIFHTFDVVPVSLEPITSADWKKIKPDSAERPLYSVLDCSAYTAIARETLPDWRDGLYRYRKAIQPS
jgi:dTDP-4-dehydrorhamnose reductase